MSYSIIVNTCDSYDDCWKPFFRLFEVFWPDCKGKIYLNTEYKTFSYHGIDIISTKVCEKRNYPKNSRMPWSLCLKDALNQTRDDIILYMQEDYFLKAPVKNDILEDMVRLMENHEDIKCIHVMNWQGYATEESPYPHFQKIPDNHPYRMSCQTALWKKEELLAILANDESGWDTEHFASKRSSKLGHLYLAPDENWIIEDCFEIVPYIFTGIEGGKWDRKNVYKMGCLFRKYGIDIDFSKRGISKPVSLFHRVANRLRIWNKEFCHKEGKVQ